MGQIDALELKFLCLPKWTLQNMETRVLTLYYLLAGINAQDVINPNTGQVNMLSFI